MIITPSLVIGMLVVFILLFLFLNTVDKRKWLTGLISLIVTPLAYFHVFYPFINIISSYHHQKYFDSEAWIEKPALRYEMIDYTIASDTLKGMTKSEISKALGHYEWLTWNDSIKAHDNNKWNYGLGIEPGAFNDKIECIEITFVKDQVLSLKQFQQLITYNKKNEEK